MLSAESVIKKGAIPLSQKTIMPDKSIRIMQLVMALEVGGLEKVVIDLIKGLQGVHPEWSLAAGFLSHPGPWAEELAGVTRWCGNPRLHKHFLDVRILGSLVRFLKKEKVDLIHSHNPVPQRYAFFASLLTGIPMIHTRHGRNYPDNRRAVFLNRLYAHRARKIIAVSCDAAQVAQEIERIPAGKVQIIPNGVDTDHFAPPADPDIRQRLRQEKGIPKNHFVIGSVGRLSPEKDYPLLIRSFKKFHCRYPESLLIIIGDGPDRKRLEECAREQNITDFTILPGSQTDILAWLQVFDVFALILRTEGASVSLLEACAAGIPGVVSDVGGNREVIPHQIAGIAIGERTEDNYADAFLSLAENPRLKMTYSTAARKHVLENYSGKANVVQYAKLIKKNTGNE